MVVGHGNIAKVLPERDDLIFFASGVSNSRCTDNKEFMRELNLLSEIDRRSHLVYFSSLAVFYLDTSYTRHKLYMEKMVKQYFQAYTIIRIGNIEWDTNPTTLINYLRAHPEAEIRDEYRYVISKAEFLHWIDLIPTFNCEMNCPGQMMKVKEIQEKYVQEN